MRTSDIIGPSGVAAAIGAIGAAFTYVAGRRKARAEVESINIANANSSVEIVRRELTSLIEAQRRELDRQAALIDGLRSEVDLLRTELSTARALAAQASADRQTAIGRIDQLSRHVEQLEAAMTDGGITPPDRPWTGGAN